MFTRISAPYAIGVTHFRLAQVALDAASRSSHVAAVRTAWLSIGFDHLLPMLDEAFGPKDTRSEVSDEPGKDKDNQTG